MINGGRNRAAQTASCLVVALCLAVVSGAAHAQVTLEGAVVNLGFSNGTVTTGTFNTTNVVDNSDELYLATGDFTLHPNYLTQSSTPNLNYGLSLGDNTFSGYMDMTDNYAVLNLYFGSSSTPSISVYAADTSNLSSTPGYAADSQGGMMGLLQPSGRNISYVNGSGAVSFTDGNDIVTLTNFVVANDAGLAGNAPCAFSNRMATAACLPNNTNETGIEFTLDVTPARTLAAASNATPNPVNFGIVHVGSSATQALSFSNTATPSGGTERLDGSIASNSSGIGAGGSLSLLAAQSTSTALHVSLDTGTAGVKSGTATISLESDGAGTSGDGTTSLGSQTVSVSGTVNNYAVAELAKVSGPATLTGSGNAYTLNLGKLAAGSGIHSEILAALNGATGPADLLSGYFTETGSGFGLTGFSAFSDLGAQQASGDLDISIGTGVDGTFLETVDLHSIGSNSSGYSGALPDVILTLEASVVPEPMSAALLGIGLIGLVGARRRRA